MCSNQASVPNSLPPLYMIDRFTSFRPSSMDEILLKTAFCTENQCRACQNHARSAPARAQGVPEPCPHAFQTTSGVVCTQVWTNYPRGRLIPVAVRVVVCLDINAQTLDLAFLVRRIISRMIQHRLRRIRTGARRQLLPPKPLL